MDSQNKKTHEHSPYFEEEEYFVTALVPSDTACLASSPGKISRTLEVLAMMEGACDWYNIRCLNLTRRDSRLLVVCSEFGSLSRDTLEDVWSTSVVRWTWYIHRTYR